MNVPKLRFKEFNDEWKKTNIKNVCNVVGGGTPDTNNLSYWNGDIQWFTPSEIGKTKYISKSERTITDLGFKNSSAKMLPKGAILLTSRATIGEASILLNEACTNQGFQSLIANKNIDNEFVFYSKELFKNEMYKKAFGSTFLEISKSNIEKIEISIPSLEEQNKISKFISLLDKKIELQSKKIEALKLYKKGLIDHLVSNMNIVNSKKLSQLGYTYSGLSGKSKEDFVDGNCKFITFMSVLKNNISENLFSTVKIGEKERQNKVLKGDLFFTGSSETKEEVGMVSTLNYDFDNLYLNSFCFGFRLNLLDEINNNFLCNLLLSSKYRKIISNLGQGFTRVNISKKELLDIDIEYPDYDNQLRITNTLNNMYSKIKLEEEKLSKLESLKKGLMQNMFV